MFKRVLTTQALALLLLGGGLTISSCNRADSERTAANGEMSTDQTAASQTGTAQMGGAEASGDQAYNDFKTFVTETEANAAAVGNKTQAEWNEETDQLRAEYEAKVAAAEADMDNWDGARRNEYERLQTRYTTAYDQRQAAYNGNMAATTTGGSTSGSATRSSSTMKTSSSAAKTGKYYRMSNPAGRLTATNARQTYESFVQMVKQNENRYDIDDWRNVNAEWRALDAKYDKIKSDVSTADRAEIAKEKAKYAAFKSFDKGEARVSQGADLATGQREEAASKGQGVRVEQSAKNAGSDVISAGKSVGKGTKNVAEKVGDKTKEGYKEVKSEVKNTDKD